MIKIDSNRKNEGIFKEISFYVIILKGDFMRILIDADACPSVKEIVELGKKYQKEVLIFVDSSHQIESDYAKVFTCDVGYQSVDMHLLNEVNEKDIVVTQDYGVAVIALGKKAFALHPLGNLYENDKMEYMLEVRHQNGKLRKSGVHIKGPKKRTTKDHEKLLSTLEKIITNF